MHQIVVLVHSPLVGPYTWEPVAERLRAAGEDARVPELREPTEGTYWEAQASSVADALEDAEADARVTYVAHSGSGPLLPAISEYVGRAVEGYVFVDAGLPAKDTSRLHAAWIEDQNFAEALARELDEKGAYPNWTSEDLEADIPDPATRERLIEEMKPRGLDYFTEPLPVFPEWPDAPCAYILFSDPYVMSAFEARERRWWMQWVEGSHFHMLVEPDRVTEVLLEAIRSCRTAA